MSWLLVFIPVAVAIEHLFPASHVLIFLASALAIPVILFVSGRSRAR